MFLLFLLSGQPKCIKQKQATLLNKTTCNILCTQKGDIRIIFRDGMGMDP